MIRAPRDVSLALVRLPVSVSVSVSVFYSPKSLDVCNLQVHRLRLGQASTRRATSEIPKVPPRPPPPRHTSAKPVPLHPLHSDGTRIVAAVSLNNSHLGSRALAFCCVSCSKDDQEPQEDQEQLHPVKYQHHPIAVRAQCCVPTRPRGLFPLSTSLGPVPLIAEWVPAGSSRLSRLSLAAAVDLPRSRGVFSDGRSIL